MTKGARRFFSLRPSLGAGGGGVHQNCPRTFVMTFIVFVIHFICQPQVWLGVVGERHVLISGVQK